MSISSDLKSGSALDTKKLSSARLDAFLSGENLEKTRAEIEKLRNDMKSEEGFLRTVFSVFSKETPTEEILKSAEAFQEFCRKNNIRYDVSEDQLERVKTLTDHLRHNKFLLAALAGTLAGLHGMDVGDVEIVNKTPGLFFAALPLLAVPFISMNIFKSFSERNIVQELGTFARFAGLMAAGIAVGFGATEFMSDQLGAIDLSRAYYEQNSEELRGFWELLKASYEQFAQGDFNNGLAETTALLKKYSLADYLLPAMGGSIGLTFAYKGLKDKSTNAKNWLTQKFCAAGAAVGDAVNKFTPYFDKAFMGFINVTGPIAIFSLLSMTMAQGGAEDLKQYMGYYQTVLLAMGVAGVGLLSSVIAYGHGFKGLKEVFGVKGKAFSLSSSSATMPFTKKALEKLGISETVRNAVVPLGASFNMLGTSLYLGMTALCASMMLGHDPSLMDQAVIMATSVMVAFGAPGIPASSIAFMAPVLGYQGFTAQEQAAVFAMIMVVDRVFDMMQTSLNVAGDMAVAMDVEAGKQDKGVGAFAWRNGGRQSAEYAKKLWLQAFKSDGPGPSV
ncbi:MAG: dicarboxylate/amino acid:cation symporter [Alphaproteobacteria bacterium]|nr:dicarboxylate/amino acid:cation symporter [Alphaproteobacteria bacterium]